MESSADVILFVVNCISICLIALILVTQHVRKIPRHPVVTTILYTAIPRSIVAALPALARTRLNQDFPFSISARVMANQDTPLAHFCAAQGIFMYYLLAVQAAFSVSFTVPMLTIAIQSTKLWQSSATTRPTRSMVKLPSSLLLCAGPFVWSIPVVCVAIAAIIVQEGKYPTIYFTPTGYCDLDAYFYQVTSGVIVGTPLLVGAVLAILIILCVARFYLQHSGVPRRGRRLDGGLMIRFTGILLIIYLDAILLLSEISLADGQIGRVWNFDTYWTTLTPILEFLIFGLQPPFLRAWKEWIVRGCCCFVPRQGRAPGEKQRDSAFDSTASSQDVTSPSYVPPYTSMTKFDDTPAVPGSHNGVSGSPQDYHFQDESQSSAVDDPELDYTGLESGSTIDPPTPTITEPSNSASSTATPTRSRPRPALFKWERPPRRPEDDVEIPVLPPSPLRSEFGGAESIITTDLEQRPGSSLGLTPAGRTQGGALDFLYDEMNIFLGTGTAVAVHNALHRTSGGHSWTEDADTELSQRMRRRRPEYDRERRRPSAVGLMPDSRYGTDGRLLRPISEVRAAVRGPSGSERERVRIPPATAVRHDRFAEAHAMWPLQGLMLPGGIPPPIKHL